MPLYQEKCEHCGALKTAYSNRLNTSLVGALRKLVDEYQETMSPVLPKRLGELGLTHNQQANFQKLQYFELVELVKKGGGWLPTQKGLGFIFGHIPVQDTIISFDNKPIEETHEAYLKLKARPSFKYVWEICEFSYKKLDEYKAEKSGQTTLNIDL